MVEQQVDAALLKRPIDVKPDLGDQAAVQGAVKRVLVMLYAAKRPSVLVDGTVGRRRGQGQVDALVRKFGFRTFIAPMGKGCLDETLPNFAGLDAGAGSDSSVKKLFEPSDLVITIGNIQSYLNTAGFTSKSPETTIALHYTHCDIGPRRIDQAPFKAMIPALTDAFDPSNCSANHKWLSNIPHPQASEQITLTDDGEITHEWLWPRLSSWFRTGDIVVTDTGTSYVGYWGSSFPSNVQVINQLLWSSIGYGVGATQGAALAAREAGRGQRTICFEGYGKTEIIIAQWSRGVDSMKRFVPAHSTGAVDDHSSRSRCDDVSDRE
jgi:pyruvate decarboxylase